MQELDFIPQVQPWLDNEEAEAAAQAVRDNWITEGPRCQAFHEKLCRLIGAPHGVFAPNGTLALALGLMGLGIGRGDEVLLPDTTFIGSANAVLLVGATPVFVDVDAQNFQIDLAHAQSRIGPRTRAIMPVHLYGAACDMTAIMAFAARHKLLVIEDAAQGIGVSHAGRHVGSFGDVGCFSFFADKTITMGEGGFVTCRDDAMYRRLRLLRNQGRMQAGSFVHPAIGYNFRITDIQAAIGLVQLDKLPTIIARKLAIHERYRQALAAIGQVRMLGAAPGGDFVPFRCVLLAERAQALMQFLETRRIQTRGFFYPLHRQPFFAEYFGDAGPSLRDEDYPNAMAGYEKGVCLPIHPTLTHADVDRIAAAVAAFYAQG